MKMAIISNICKNCSIMLCILFFEVSVQDKRIVIASNVNDAFDVSTFSSKAHTSTANDNENAGNLSFSEKVQEKFEEVEQLESNIKHQKWCTKVTIEEKCPNSNISFWLYNRNHSKPYLLDEIHRDTIKNAPFIPKVPIKILLHGYAGNKRLTPNKEIRPIYVKKGYNVISIDYENVVPHPCYIQAAKNIVRVGRCFAKFIKILINTKEISRHVSMKDFHVVGFCLGAQVAGKAGLVLADDDKFFPRITSLDASLPLFSDIPVLISKDSAKFVDAIHTNIMIFGKLLPIGHVDFYVNRAIFQGRCKITDAKCKHGMAAVYFAESINSKIPFCGNDLFFRNINAIMGEHTPVDTRGLFNVITNKEPPYARGCQKESLNKEYLKKFKINDTHSVML